MTRRTLILRQAAAFCGVMTLALAAFVAISIITNN